jgi:hypothetical protein
MIDVPARRREVIIVTAVHIALILASWLTATLVYAFAVVRAPQLGWAAIDAAIVLGLGAFIYRHRAVLGFRALGAHRGRKLIGVLGVGLVCALIIQLLIRDRNGIWLDESNYLLTARSGTIIRDGLLPFNLRWLVPFLAGPWNVLALDDIDALKAINFGAFALTGGLLVLLLVRLRVRLGLALTAPVFLLCSYLGLYGAQNRLVVDPFNYAMFVVLFHLLIRRDHRAWFGLTLFVTAFNAEKAIYWVPVFAISTLLRHPQPWRWRDVLDAIKVSAWVCGPTVIYIIAIRLYLAPSRTEWNLCFENLNLMSFSAFGAKITNNNVLNNNFRSQWLPFGPFTVYALLGFVLAERWMKPVLLLLIPIFIQNVIACDGNRMVAYTFIVYLPFGYVYLSRALTELPGALAKSLLVASLLVAVLGRYGVTLLGLARRLGLSSAEVAIDNVDDWKMILSGTEIALVGAIVFLHITLFRRASWDPPPPTPEQPVR